MKAPIEPDRDDCCNSGCNPCIFDVYEKQLLLYKKYIEFGESSNQCILQENSISLLEYTTFVVVKNKELCSKHHLIEFKLASGCSHVWWKPGDHFLFKYSSDKSCTRAYTPIKLSDSDFAIIVKLYDSGIVSKYLCGLEVNQETLWRGPYGSYEIIPSKYKRIFMIAQGTGIAPFISIIENILENEDNLSRIYLHFCCTSTETILFRDKLYSYKSYWNFNYEIYVTNYTNETVKYQEPIMNHKMSMDDINKFKPFTECDQFLLCGSSQFMEHYNDNITADGVLHENIIKF